MHAEAKTPKAKPKSHSNPNKPIPSMAKHQSIKIGCSSEMVTTLKKVTRQTQRSDELLPKYRVMNDSDDDFFVTVLMDEFLSSSDSNIESPVRKKSRNKAPNKNRDFEGTYRRFMKMYFDEDSTYNERGFRRRFRMGKSTFNLIFQKVLEHCDFFQHKRDCTGKLGVYPLIKVIYALRMLAYGVSADMLDENFQISESLGLDCLKKFRETIIEVFGDKYYGPPDSEGIARLLNENASRGLPGMLGSLDCMHWVWKKCPKALAGQYKGTRKEANVSVGSNCILQS